MMRKLIFILAFFLAFPVLGWATACPDLGTNGYVRAGATGTHDGSDWTNAYTGFGTGATQVDPASMVRGCIYWAAAGSYGSVTFSTAASGTSLITIESPTLDIHGTGVGWNNAYVGQAVFSESTVSTSYYTFNGQQRGSDWQSGYLLKFWNQTDGNGAAVNITGSHLTFEYVEIEGTGAGFPTNNSTADKCDVDDCGSWHDTAILNNDNSGNNATSYLYVGYCYVHHTGNTQFQLNYHDHNYATFEYDWVSYNHTGQNGVHDEAFSITYSNIIVRYCVFQDICFNGILTDAAAGSDPLSNWAFYGNLVFWDAAYAGLNGQYWDATFNDGVVVLMGEAMSGWVYVVNNTVANFNSTFAASCAGSFSTMLLPGGPGNGPNTGSPTVIVENNLMYDDQCTHGNMTYYCDANPSAVCTYDYNAFYQGTTPSGSLWSDTNTHGYVVSGSTDPMVSPTASTIAGFGLVTPDPFAAHAGTVLASPYNFDGLNGTTRGANSVWDRGAEQLPLLYPPINLRAVPH